MTGPAVPLAPTEAAELGLALHRSGCLREAEWLYRRILQFTPEQVDALHFLGVLCHQEGRSGEAVSLLRRCLELAPGQVDAWNNFGNVLQELARPSEAEAAYREALARHPDHAATWNNLAVVLAAQDRHGEALEAHRRATALAPDAPDYWYNLGNALRRADDSAGAEEAYRSSLALEPRHAESRQGLARLLLIAGRADAAAEVYREWLRLDPGNALATHMLAAATGEAAPSRATEEYVRTLFDALSTSFDDHLSTLGYRAPELLAVALARELPAPRGELTVLDAGCGTGLCGPLLRPYARCLEGVDLSPGMLRRAQARAVYDVLAEAELTSHLERSAERYDLVVSADTLCYLGDLAPTLEAAARALRPGGLVAFTLEADEGPAAAFRLTAQGRYVHGREYGEGVVKEAGLELRHFASQTLRSEGGRSVEGWVVVARRPA